MRSLISAVSLLVLNSILFLPAAAEQPVVTDQTSVAASAATASAAVVDASEPPKKNDIKVIEIDKVCAIPAYPKPALRIGMQGKTILNLMIDDAGKISAFQLEKSSGWKLLDVTVMEAIIGCQAIPSGRWIPSERKVAYLWKLNQLDVSPAVIDPKSCKLSEKLCVALDKENGVGIVVGMSISDKGKVLNAQVQWGSDDEKLDQESLRIARSCEFVPAERGGKRIADAQSIRFVEK